MCTATTDKQYFYIEFKYEGKNRASVFSKDFVLDKGAKWHEIEEKAYELFEGFMRNVLPDAMCEHLKAPEHLTIIPGVCFVVPS